MPYGLLADAVLVAHLAFVVFAVLGGILVLRWARVAWLHLPTVAWAAWVEFTGTVCPLTPLEHGLRTAAGERGYEGDFIGEYLLPVLYPAGLTREVQMALGAFVIAVNAAVYLAVWRRRRTR